MEIMAWFIKIIGSGVIMELFSVCITGQKEACIYSWKKLWLTRAGAIKFYIHASQALTFVRKIHVRWHLQSDTVQLIRKKMIQNCSQQGL